METKIKDEPKQCPHCGEFLEYCPHVQYGEPILTEEAN